MNAGPSEDDRFLFDQGWRDKGFLRIAGIDEVGRGPLAGPVLAVAVVLPPAFRLFGLRDSKKIPPARRRRLAVEVLLGCLDVGVGLVDAETIDRVNILEATRLAMKRALDDLAARPDLLLIDALHLGDVGTAQRPIVKGDDLSASIAAASVVAKELRDGLMLGYHAQYPHYHFHRHKGYPQKNNQLKCRKFVFVSVAYK